MDVPSAESAFLTVEEAAAYPRIGRSNPYEQCRRFMVTGGRAGIPCVRIGRSIRVPRRQLERLGLSEV